MFHIFVDIGDGVQIGDALLGPNRVHDVRLDGGAPATDEQIPVRFSRMDGIKETGPFQRLHLDVNSNIAQHILHGYRDQFTGFAGVGAIDQLERQLFTVGVNQFVILQRVAGLGKGR